MAYSKKHSFLLISTLLMILQLQFSSAIKGGYCYSDSGLAVSDIDPSSSFSTFTQTIQAKSSSVQTLLSIGGGGGPALAQQFANMASQASSRKSFIDSSIQLARGNNFNGLDLDWEYPSSDTDKTNFGLLITEWRAAVAQEASSSSNPALLLSAAVGGSDQITPLQYYPGQDIADNLDWVNVMTIDLFTSDGYPTSTQAPAPLKNPTGQFSVEEDANNHGLFATATQGLGAVKYRDIINTGAEVVYDSTYVTNYCFTGTDWYGYDDTQSISAKVDYAKQNGLFGYFAWHIEQDSNWALSQAASQAWDG
ncbi:chitinase [Trifolium repens]|nr:chitinase [Trifolium repens]